MKYRVINYPKDLPEVLKHSQWDAVISLGGTCQVAYQLKRQELRAFSGPFDWIFSTEPDMVSEALDKDFEGWLLLENLHEEISQSECRKIIDDRYHTIHQHIFPFDKTYEEAYSDVKTTVKRRIDRLLNLKNKRLLFVRTNLTSEEAEKMSGIISKRYGPNSYLLVINHRKNNQIRFYPQEKENVLVFEIYDENENTGQRWQGYDDHWDTIFAYVSLKGVHSMPLSKNILFNGMHPYEQDEDGHGFRWTKKESSIDVTGFEEKTINIKLVCPFKNTLRIYDENNHILNRCTFASINLFEVIKNGRLRVVEREISIKIPADTQKIYLKCTDDWIPSQEDLRKLSVCIQSITVT